MLQGAPCNAHTLDINVVINWQLSKQGTSITWAQLSTHRGQVFFEVIRWLLVTRFQMIAGSSLIFLKFHMKYVVFVWRTIKILILNWPRTRKFSQLLQAGKTVALLSMVKRWSRSTSISDWSKFEFMRKIYAASWILFTWTAEADRALCQLVTFLTVFFLRF